MLELHILLYTPDYTKKHYLPTLDFSFSILCTHALSNYVNTWGVGQHMSSTMLKHQKNIDWSDVNIILNSQNIFKKKKTCTMLLGECFSVLNFQWLLSTLIGAAVLKVSHCLHCKPLCCHFIVYKRKTLPHTYLPLIQNQ